MRETYRLNYPAQVVYQASLDVMHSSPNRQQFIALPEIYSIYGEYKNFPVFGVNVSLHVNIDSTDARSSELHLSSGNRTKFYGTYDGLCLQVMAAFMQLLLERLVSYR